MTREAAQERTDRPFVEAVERAADGEDGEDRTGRLPDRLDAARFGPSRGPFQVLNDPAVQDDQLVEDDETTFDEPPLERDPACRRCPTASPRTTRGASSPSQMGAPTGTSRQRGVP